MSHVLRPSTCSSCGDNLSIHYDNNIIIGKIIIIIIVQNKIKSMIFTNIN